MTLENAYKGDKLLARIQTEFPSDDLIEEESDFDDLLQEHVREAEKHLAKATQLRRAEVARKYAEAQE